MSDLDAERGASDGRVPDRAEFWIDVGGTFTDCIGRFPDGTTRRHKTLSSGLVQGTVELGSDGCQILDSQLPGTLPDLWRGYRFQLLDDSDACLAEPSSAIVSAFDPRSGRLTLETALAVPPQAGQRFSLSTGEHAPLLAIRYLLGVSADELLGEVDVRLGTTRGTNALLTRTGARVGLVTTPGLADGLEIGYQNRPRLFELNIRKPTRLYEEVLEVDERLAADGSPLSDLNVASTIAGLERLRRSGIESLAICLLHSYANPVHERLVRDLALEVGFPHISMSHEVSQTMGWVARGDTTVVDAYLSPVLATYLLEIRKSLGEGSRLQLLTSSGALVSDRGFRGKDSVLSGPAGGVVGFSAAAKAAGFSHSIGFDMGGTSTDVSRFAGAFERQFETEKAGVRIVVPMMAIETVAAGGGSICDFDGLKLSVGPASAGANPGPACYGRGGPLTVTDINLTLGKLQTSRLPFSLDHVAVEQRLDTMLNRLRDAGHRYNRVELANGFLEIANQNIVQAVRSVSVAKGVDPSEYVLTAFGGAAGQHACAVADSLGMTSILLHPDAGVLSAVGIGHARAAQHAEQAIYQPLHDCAAQLNSTLGDVTQAAIAKLRQDVGSASDPAAIEFHAWVEMRYTGTQTPLAVAWDDGNHLASSGSLLFSTQRLAERFHDQHEARYGYRRDLSIEVVRIRGEAEIANDQPLAESQRIRGRVKLPANYATVHFEAAPMKAGLFVRDEILAGEMIEGPALIAEPHATTVIDPGWHAIRLTQGELLVEKREDVLLPVAPSKLAAKSAPKLAAPTSVEADFHGVSLPADPVKLEIIHNYFASIADQMGLALRATAISVNVKERLDFSCALFTRSGDLIANAPHVPVHLGAMSETVRSIIDSFPEMHPGDAYISNDPFRGGSHLPDITVVSPAFVGDHPEPEFYVASRAHHAEIGGVVPGSMPPNSTRLEEEGVLLSNLKLADRGTPDWADIERRLSSTAYPSRCVADNLADIAAQLSANHRGVAGLHTMVESYGAATVSRYAEFAIQASARKMRLAIAKLPRGRRVFRDSLDNGATIEVEVEFRGDNVRIDFTGTSAVQRGNCNANRAITTAAIMYCLRLLLREDVPLNQGVLEPLELVLPECFLNPRAASTPGKSPAVAAGNVETSQRIVDVLLGAFELAAASQGTMNNLTFGNATFGYYETIGGGEGATPHGPGASAVHTHMTNTRLTDPEVLEFRLPVRLWDFSIRRGSGGAGQHRGGDGLVREIEFLEPLSLALVTNRRAPFRPYGLAGGQPGGSGENRLIHASGEEILPAVIQRDVLIGERLRISTPGGGGWGVKGEG